MVVCPMFPHLWCAGGVGWSRGHRKGSPSLCPLDWLTSSQLSLALPMMLLMLMMSQDSRWTPGLGLQPRVTRKMPVGGAGKSQGRKDQLG